MNVNDTNDSSKVDTQPQLDNQPKVKKIIKKTNDQTQAVTKPVDATKPVVSNTSNTSHVQNPHRGPPKTHTQNARAEMFSKAASSNNVLGRRESKPIETFGSDVFKNRLSIFDKGKDNTDVKKEANAPKKLDMSKLGSFSSQPNSSSSSKPENTGGVSLGIQQRLNMYLENARNRCKTTVHLDPVFNILKDVKKQGNAENIKEETEEINNNISGDELSISSGDDEKKEESNKDKDEEKKDKDEEKKDKDEEKKVKEKNEDDLLDDDDLGDL